MADEAGRGAEHPGALGDLGQWADEPLGPTTAPPSTRDDLTPQQLAIVRGQPPNARTPAASLLLTTHEWNQ